MTVTFQIILGSFLLFLCSLFHISMLVRAGTILRHFGPRLLKSNINLYREILTIIAFGCVILAHTVQVWLWALAFALLGAFETLSNAIYFSIVTYTTLGYGDVTLRDGLRIFGAMASITGLLNFGLSTAFLVSVFNQLFRDAD